MTLYVETKDDKDSDKENKLPKLEQGDKVTATQIEPAQHFTQPPPRYTEARLVKTLEELKNWTTFDVCTNDRYNSKT